MEAPKWRRRLVGGAGRTPAGTSAGEDQAVAERVADELRPVPQAGLAEDVVDVGLHRGLGHDQGGGDLRVRLPGRDVHEHLALARRQPLRRPRQAGPGQAARAATVRPDAAVSAGAGREAAGAEPVAVAERVEKPALYGRVELRVDGGHGGG